MEKNTGIPEDRLERMIELQEKQIALLRSLSATLCTCGKARKKGKEKKKKIKEKKDGKKKK